MSDALIAFAVSRLERRRLEQKLVERAEHWARACIDRRHTPGVGA